MTMKFFFERTIQMLHWLLFLKYSQHILKKYENSIEQNNDFLKKTYLYAE